MNLLQPVDENICAVNRHASDGQYAGDCGSYVTETEIITEFPDLFEGIGRFDSTVHFDVDESMPPVQIPLHRLPLCAREKVAAELRRLEDAGIITPVTEPTKWVSALLVLAKANGNLRSCLDPKPLNKALLQHSCLPTIRTFCRSCRS